MSDSSTSADRVSLGTFPTPLEPAPRLAAALGLTEGQLWIKRDDLTGLGGGGNKARKLERAVATALRGGADALITTGAAQSNHARLTAAAGARFGLPVTLVLSGGPGQPAGPGTAPSAPAGNLLLDGILGARIRWAGDVGHSELDAIAGDTAAELSSAGAHPAIIPFGGSNRDGALAYADAARELRAQLPGEAVSVVALGSGGTMAGLVAGLGAQQVLGVHVGAVADPRAVTAALASLIAAEPVAPESLRVRTDQVGAGYGALTAQSAEAIRLTARTEGIILDPVYTGRAMAGLTAAVRDGDITPDTAVVFWHTGGLPGLFGHPEAATIPSELP
jgi:D-cysteine desulfhydrase